MAPLLPISPAQKPVLFQKALGSRLRASAQVLALLTSVNLIYTLGLPLDFWPHQKYLNVFSKL